MLSLTADIQDESRSVPHEKITIAATGYLCCWASCGCTCPPDTSDKRCGHEQGGGTLLQVGSLNVLSSYLDSVSVSTKYHAAILLEAATANMPNDKSCQALDALTYSRQGSDAICKDFLRQPRLGCRYPRPSVTVDAAIIAKPADGKPAKLLLIQRKKPPCQVQLSVPDG